MSMLKDWKKAKLEFEKMTSKKKPTPETNRFFHTSGVESALKAYEKTEFWDVPVKKEAAAVKALEKQVISYANVLKAAVAKEPAESKPTVEKALKMLRTRLKRYLARAEAHLADKEAKATDDATGEKKIAGMHRRAITDVKSAAMAVRAAAAKIKAKPTPEVYNEEMIHCDTMRRALYFVSKAREAGDQALADPAPHEATIKAYHEGAYRWAPKDDSATPELLTKQAIDAYKICKGIMAVYSK